jgi:hypothetical protein
MRTMGQMRLPWNVYENKLDSRLYPGIYMIAKDLAENRQSAIANRQLADASH